MMRVWAAINQKGGVGKSTVVLNLAIASCAAGSVTSVIDLDPQKSAEQWSALREARLGTPDPVVVFGTAMHLDAMLGTARRTGTDLVIIDTPAAIDQTTIFTAEAADLIIVPTRGSILDAQALDGTLAVLRATKALHKAVVVLNATGSDERDRGEVIRIARRKHKVPVLDVELEDRPDFRRTLGIGKGVTEHAPRGKAAQELMRLYTSLCKWDAKSARRKGKVQA